MTFSRVCRLFCLALFLAQSALSHRLPGKAAQTPEAKVVRLLADIGENVRKEGEDAELVFATLSNFEQQFDTSLDHEITMLNETLVKLTAMDSEYGLEMNSSRDELQYLGTSVQGSEQAVGAYGAGAAKASKKYDSLLNSVHMLVALLQAAKVTPQGQLATPEAPDASGRPRRVYAAMWKLLSTRPEMRANFADVFAAFAPAGQSSLAQTPSVTPAVLQHAVAALRHIGAKLQDHKSVALMQIEGKQEQFAASAHADQLNVETQRGVEAEDEQKSAELSYSMNFTMAVLEIDRDFHARLRKHMGLRLNLTQSARGRREGLLKTLTSLVAHMMIGGQERAKPVAMSFLEVDSKTSSNTPKKLSTLQTAVEDAIRKGDTHAILLKIKTVLAQGLPVDANSVQGIVTKMGNVLHAVESEQTRAEDAKRRCDAQKFHAVEEDRGLKANLALMSAAQNHTRAAIQAAKNNLNGITAKVEALERSSTDFAQLVSQALATLGGQSRDRGTIMSAVKKAQEVMARSAAGGNAVTGGLKHMSEELSAQEADLQAFRGEEAAFQTALKQYANDYAALLQGRRGHYRQSLAALDLYTSELVSDVASQTDAVKSNDELVTESRQLCDSVMTFYTMHSKRRSELSGALRAVLPKVPEILSIPSASQDEQ